MPLLALLATATNAQQTLLLRSPDISADKIAFVYAGDIWVANRDGLQPRRLTSSPADENHPLFSPDGSTIAFQANYEDNEDVYVIPVNGGQPQRLTWHPGDDVPTGWTSDGQAVSFVSDRETDHGRSGQLYHAALSGGLPAKQMEARVYRGVYSDDDSKFAYIAFGAGYNGLFGGTAGWKGYRGGVTPPIHVMDLESQNVRTIDGAASTNFDPMWIGNDIYFLSDRDDKTFNVFRFDDTSGAIRKVSNETEWDVRDAGAHGNTIIYEAGGRLKQLDTLTGNVREIVIDIEPDLPQLRPQWKNASETIQWAEISPTGKRAIVTARGEIFTVPVEDGSTRNITRTGGTREYTGIWSPKGDRVAYIVESGSGQTLIISDQAGMGERQQYELGPYFYELIQWGGGDNSRIVFRDNHLTLYALEVANGRISTIATGARRDDIEAAI